MTHDAPLSASDLQAYLQRIQYNGPLEPSPASLSALAEAHSATFPFENLDVWCERPFGLDPPSVLNKLVTHRRGGYCFEQNALFGWALLGLGFEVGFRAGRARTHVPRDFTPPRTHLLLTVALEGLDWWVDVGLGGLQSIRPLRLEPGLVQPTPQEERRVLHEGDVWYVQAKLGENWIDTSETRFEPMPPIDREIGHFYCSRHVDSGFRKTLLLARAEPDGTRHTLRGRKLGLRKNGELHTETLDSEAALRTALAERFGLEPDFEVRLPPPEA